MIGSKKRNDIAMIGSKKREAMMIGSKHMAGRNPLAISSQSSDAQQKSVLEKMTKTGHNLGLYA